MYIVYALEDAFKDALTHCKCKQMGVKTKMETLICYKQTPGGCFQVVVPLTATKARYRAQAATESAKPRWQRSEWLRTVFTLSEPSRLSSLRRKFVK